MTTFDLMFRKTILIALFGSIFLLYSCEDESAPAVAYLEVSELLVASKSSEGTSSAKLNTIWVEQNGQQIGAFSPPCRIPVYAGENQLLRFIPGIALNGVYSQRNQYEMLSPIEKNWDLNEGSTRVLSPQFLTFEYNPTYDLIVVEDFDGIGLNYNKTIQSDTNLLITSDTSEVFHYPGETPNKSGKFVLPPVTLGEFKTLQAFDLPKYGANIWLEVNYKTDVALTFGVTANEILQSAKTPVVTLFPNEEWNKVYINLVTEVSGYPNALDYNLFFGSINTTDDTATVLIDNIKLLY
ncbi:MAG TPA: hypothetical protein DDZ07_00800 [Cryomorphaceae bacterium]|nr:hypothetical protein [Cryomorphaceae bacterium]